MSYFHNKNGMLTTLSARLFYRFRNGQTERLEKIHKTLKLFFFFRGQHWMGRYSG